MTVNDTTPIAPQEPPGLVRRYVWNRTAITAVLLSTPVILSAVGSFVLSQSVDERIAELNRRRDLATATTRELAGFKDRLQSDQVSRGSFLLLLDGMNAGMDLKYALDRLFRLNGQDSMRRVAAILYPDDWKTRMAPYEAIVATSYNQPGQIEALQITESTMIADAAQALTRIELQANALSDDIDDQMQFRTAILSIGNSVMYLLSILFFFLRTAHGQKPAA